MYKLIPGQSYIKVRFISESGFISDAIKSVSRSPEISHVEFITPEGNYLGARSEGGVQERNADYCKPSWERRYAIPTLATTASKVLEQGRSKIGTKYDFSDILGLMFQNASIHNPSREICSEFVYSLITSQGFHCLNVLEDRSYLITPEMVHLSPMFIGRCYYEGSTK